MQRTLKKFADISDILDAWSFGGCTGSPGMQRYTLRFKTEKSLLTLDTLAYYQGTVEWPSTAIKLKMTDAAFFSLQEGTWKNNGFSVATEGREAICTLILEMKNA